MSFFEVFGTSRVNFCLFISSLYLVDTCSLISYVYMKMYLFWCQIISEIFDNILVQLVKKADMEFYSSINIILEISWHLQCKCTEWVSHKDDMIKQRLDLRQRIKPTTSGPEVVGLSLWPRSGFLHVYAHTVAIPRTITILDVIISLNHSSLTNLGKAY